MSIALNRVEEKEKDEQINENERNSRKIENDNKIVDAIQNIPLEIVKFKRSLVNTHAREHTRSKQCESGCVFIFSHSFYYVAKMMLQNVHHFLYYSFF